MPTYQDYTKYHIAYNQEEQNTFNQYNNVSVMPDGTTENGIRREGDLLIDEVTNKVVRPIPEVVAHMMVAYGRAQEQLSNIDRSGVYPEGLDDTKGCEGIDPKGHLTRYDLELEKRIKTLKQVSITADPEVRKAIEESMSKLNDPSSKAGKLRHAFLQKCEDCRFDTRAAKLAQSKTAHDMLMEKAQETKGTPIEEMQEALRGLEFMAGIYNHELSPSEKKKMETLFELDNRTLVNLNGKRFDLKQGEQGLSIPFANFDNTLTQKYLAHPQNWGKTAREAPQDYKNPVVAEGNIQTYSHQAVKASLDTLYANFEFAHAGVPLSDIFNRTKLILVDGKTVEQIMRETHAMKKNSQPYEQWAKENREGFTSDIVVAGLMTGKRVEGFVAGKDGKIKGEPIQITKTGYKPEPLRPVTMDRWQKFCSFFGKHKEKVEKNKEYDRLMEARKEVIAQNEKDLQQRVGHIEVAREKRYDATLAGGQVQNDIYLRDYILEDPTLSKVRASGPLGYGREKLGVACVCGLIAQNKYSIEDILDNTKLLDEKAQMGKYFLHLSADKTPEEIGENSKMVGRWFYQGQRQLVNYVDQKLEKKDLSNIIEDPEFPKLTAMAKITFDVTQILNATGTQYRVGHQEEAARDFARDPKLREELKDHKAFKNGQPGTELTQEQREACSGYVDCAGADLSAVMVHIHHRNKFRAKEKLSKNDAIDHLSAEVFAQTIQQELKFRHEANPNARVSSLITYAEIAEHNLFVKQSQTDANNKHLFNKDLECDKLQEKLLSGDYEKRLKAIGAKGMQNPNLAEDLQACGKKFIDNIDHECKKSLEDPSKKKNHTTGRH
ncbi:MAG: hypothetical protein R3Y07_08310 [Eubacteriales bacterium]